MTKILVVLTNITHYQKTTDATGLWLGEATEFVNTVQQAGWQVDYVSPQGGYVPLDPRGLKYAQATDFQLYASSDFQTRALSHSLRPSDIDPADYAAIYYTGGHGVMWDFPNNAALQAISLAIYHQGGYLTSVCHGIAGLLNIKTETGAYLIADRQITGFTTSEEWLSGKKSVVPFLNEQLAKAHGAHFQKKRAYATFAIQDGQLITGQNPFSATAVAHKLLDNLA